MAIEELTAQLTTRAGITPTFTAAATDGFAIDNRLQDVLLYIKNAGASPVTVTIGPSKTIDGRTLAAHTVTVANGSEKLVGPFPSDLYNKNELVTGIAKALVVTFSATTSVTIAALKIGSLSH
jgi:hypothetical protein